MKDYSKFALMAGLYGAYDLTTGGPKVTKMNCKKGHMYVWIESKADETSSFGGYYQCRCGKKI